MIKLLVKNISVNETNDFYVVECGRGIFGLIPKKEENNQRTIIKSPMYIFLYEGEKTCFDKVYFSKTDLEKLSEDKVPYDENLIKRASFNKEMRLFLFKQLPFRRWKSEMD